MVRCYTVRGKCHIINSMYDTVYSVYYTLGKTTLHQVKVLGAKRQIDKVTGDATQHRTSSYVNVILVLIAPLNCWRNSTPF